VPAWVMLRVVPVNEQVTEPDARFENRIEPRSPTFRPGAGAVAAGGKRADRREDAVGLDQYFTEEEGRSSSNGAAMDRASQLNVPTTMSGRSSPARHRSTTRASRSTIQYSPTRSSW